MRTLLLLIPLAACAQPVPLAEVAFSIPDAELIPEGIAFDPAEGAFYVGSTNQRKIVRVDQDGTVRDFVGSGDDGLWGVLGLRIDPTRRVLWVASSHAGVGMPIQNMDPAEEGYSGLFKYDLVSGALIKKYVLTNNGEAHFLNDLTVTGDGTVYATDSSEPAIYRIDVEVDTLELFVSAPDLPSPNGIDWSEEAGALYVALSGQIGRIEPGDPTIHYLDLPDGAKAYADGLYFFDQSLVTVWPFDGNPGVTRYQLSPSFERVVSIESLLPTHPTYLQPTTGAIVGDAIYVIANSQLQLFRAIYAGEVEGGFDQLADPVVLRVGLDGRRTR